MIQNQRQIYARKINSDKSWLLFIIKIITLNETQFILSFLYFFIPFLFAKCKSGLKNSRKYALNKRNWKTKKLNKQNCRENWFQVNWLRIHFKYLWNTFYCMKIFLFVDSWDTWNSFITVYKALNKVSVVLKSIFYQKKNQQGKLQSHQNKYIITSYILLKINPC